LNIEKKESFQKKIMKGNNKKKDIKRSKICMERSQKEEMRVEYF